MVVPELACAASGYDVAGLPNTDRAIRCPECSHLGPPVAPKPRDTLYPWRIASLVGAVAANLLVLTGSLLIGIVSFAVDGSLDHAIRAAIPMFILATFCAVTLVVMCLPRGAGASGLRVGVAIGHALLLIAACILGFGGAAGQRWDAPLWVALLLGGQAVTSIATLLLGTGLLAHVRSSQSSAS